MRKKILMLCIPACLLMSQIQSIRAEDFAGNEQYYSNLCLYPSDTQSQADQCARFKEYMTGKTADLDNQISSLTDKINNKQLEADGYAAVINEQMTIIQTLESAIAQNLADIATIQTNVQELSVKIEETQVSINERDTLVKERMRAEQKNVGTNMYIEFLMGATDVMDFIRIIEGIQIITESDQDLIKSLEDERAQMKLDQEEQKRLEAEVIAKNEENEANKQKAEDLKAATEPLKAKAEEILSNLESEKRNAQYNADTIRNNIDNISTDVKFVEEGSDADNGDSGNVVIPPTSNGFMRPINGGVENGTWYYAGSNVVHLGVDVAVGNHSPIYAPASGYIVYGANPDGTNSGWFGNGGGSALWGAGNTILLLCEVNGNTYAINFAHMAQENFAGYSGTSVTQGQFLGETGSSGNVTGPHAHVEVVNLGSIGIAKAVAVFQRYGDFAFGAGWGTTGLSYTCQNTGWSTPCRERPESIFGY